ncbi:MAG TPA: NAD-dependent epimerase/dehydratase family protein [Kofleriaceae bacterium]|jgi:nucleoside-diphosphate-sugar epimerase
MSNLHVVFGSGQIGSRVARLLQARGDRVRVVARHPTGGDETRAGDARDLDFAASAGEGATTVIDCMNPPYHKWKDELIAVGKGSLHAAQHNHAKLVALDCLYMYGAPDGPMTEQTPNAPCSKKGELRVQLAELRLRSGHPVAIGRASDFFGPGLTQSWWSPRALTRLANGKAMELCGDADQPHSYSFADDVAAGLVSLATSDATGIWHLPTLPAITTRELAAHVVPKPKMTRLSPLMLRTIGIFQPFMKELIEMGYQWEKPFILDDSKFRARFASEPTPLAEQVAATRLDVTRNRQTSSAPIARTD